MSLTIGGRVAAYEVLALLGRGGMGEVFRGRDARLKRDVALKVLPPDAIADPDRRSRFEREAQVLAALDHPNIAKVFGVEEVHGSPVIVMELVEGPTLHERVNGRALPIDEALTIAIDLCHGLAAAHDAGVVHRDLKPANIKVRPDGVVKILDFGLALAPASAGADVANSPTVLSMRTMPGAVLGTAAYMSPEQARGRLVDARADSWAFGCVLYEMLTGRPAFSGDTTTDILAAVIHAEPDWSALPAGLPPRAEELIRRCLQKATKDRLRDLGDSAYELERARTTRSDVGPAAPSTSTTPATPALSAAGRRSSWAWMMAALAVAGAAMIAWRGAGTSPTAGVAARPAIRASLALPVGTTVALGRGSAIAISPDGSRLVYSGRTGDRIELHRRDLGSFESAVIPGTTDGTNPFFSPDGRWVGFFADRKLKKVSLDGVAPVNVADAPNPRGEAWGAQDTILVSPTNGSGLQRVSAGGGAFTPFSSLVDGESSHRWPRFLPGSGAVLFTVWNTTGWEPASIHAQRPDDNARVVVVEHNGGYPRYVRDAGTHGFLVYAREQGLMAAPFDETSLKLTGTAVPVFDGLVTNLSGGAHFDLSLDGTLAYVPGATNEGNRELQWVTLDGTASAPMAVQNFSSREWKLSPDGQRVLYGPTTGGTTRDLWLKDLRNGATTRLTQGVDSYAANWSRDGRSIFYLKGNPPRLVRRQARPNAPDEDLLIEGAPPPADISPDGRWMVYTLADGGADANILARQVPVPVSAGAAAAPSGSRPVVSTPATEVSPRFSPDGRWIVYQSNATGRFEIYVTAFPDGDQEHRLSTDGGLAPAWSASGRDVYYRAPNNAMMAVAVTPGADGLTVSRPRRLFDATRFDTPYAVSPDGTRLLMMPAVEAAPTEIRIVLNFLDELRARVR